MLHGMVTKIDVLFNYFYSDLHWQLLYCNLMGNCDRCHSFVFKRKGFIMSKISYRHGATYVGDAPRVSVLMPAYNAEKYIAVAIESILSQTFTDFEFIIINDGSTDNTAKIVQEYAKRDARIKFIDNKQNRGIATARNILLESAIGEYIAYQDSDDISVPERLAQQVSFMDAHPDVTVSCAGLQTMPGDKIITCPAKPKILDFYIANMVSNPAVIMRRVAIVNNGIKYEKRYSTAEDYAFWLDVLRHNLQIHNTADVLVKYRILQNSLSHNNPIMTKFEEIIRTEIIDSLTTNQNFRLILAPQHRIYLFGFIPVLKIKYTRIYLFEVIPLFKQRGRWWRMFDIIPIFTKR